MDRRGLLIHCVLLLYPVQRAFDKNLQISLFEQAYYSLLYLICFNILDPSLVASLLSVSLSSACKWP